MSVSSAVGKRFLLLLSVFLLALPSAAQNFTSVTATIVDPSGLPYSYATVQAQLIPTGTAPSINGKQISGYTLATADVTGKFNMNLGSTAVIVPGGSKWQFTVNIQPGIPPPAGTGSQSFVVALSISGASLDISANLNAVAPKLSNLAGGAISIAANQVAVGSGPNTIAGSANFLFSASQALLVQDTACALTPIASQTFCGIGLSTGFDGSPTIFEIVQNTDTPWSQIWSHATGTGNSGSVRSTFLGMAATGASSNNQISLNYVENNVQKAVIEFGGTTGASKLLISSNDIYDVEIGANGTGGPVTESQYFHDGNINLITPLGKGVCWNPNGASNIACILAGAGSPNSLVLPTTTGGSGQGLSTDGANPQQLSWVNFGTTNATNGTLPKRSSATAFADSALSENTTNVTTTKAMLAPNGTALLPAYSFSSTPSIGMSTDGTNLMLSVAGSNSLSVSSTFVRANLSFQYAVGLVNSVTGAPSIYATAPTIAGAGCGGSAASISAQNGTAAFKIAVGTGPSSACTVTLPAAVTGWNCSASDITTQSTSVSMQRQTGAESTTSVTITNFSDVTVPTAFVANDVLKVICFAD